MRTPPRVLHFWYRPAPRGHVLRCQILSDAAIPPDVDEPFVSIDGRDFTFGEFMTMVGRTARPHHRRRA